jgi:hypothetical protein
MAEPPKEFAEDELTKYDEGVQKRIKHFTKGYHEERRAKEAAQREKDEALRFAQALSEENNRLKGSVNQNQSALIEQAKKVVANELETAKRQYKAAYESGDSEALVNAQEALDLLETENRAARVAARKASRQTAGKKTARASRAVNPSGKPAGLGKKARRRG